MAELGFHRLEDDIADTWIEDWAGAGGAGFAGRGLRRDKPHPSIIR